MYIPKESENFINNEHIYSHYINRITNNELINDPNVKYQYDNNKYPDFYNNFGSKPEETKESSEETENGGFFSKIKFEKTDLIPVLLISIGLMGIIIITGLIIYGIKMMNQTNKERNMNNDSSISNSFYNNNNAVLRINNVNSNNRNLVSYRIKSADPYTFGYKSYNLGSGGGSKNSINVTLNSKSTTSNNNYVNGHRRFCSNVSNIVPEFYDVEESNNDTYYNSFIQNTSFQDFYNNGGGASSYNSRNENVYGYNPYNRTYNLYGSAPSYNGYSQEYNEDDVFRGYNSVPTHLNNRIQLY